MSENLEPKLPGEVEGKKKPPLAGWLFGRAGGAARGKWGSGMLGKLLGTKSGVIAMALGVTALASVAGIMIAKQEPVEIGGKMSPQLASRAAKYFTPSGARNNNRSSLSLITGNKDYGEEVAKAIDEPEAAAEEAVAAAPELPALPAAPGGAKFSPSGASASTGGGGGSPSVMSGNRNDTPQAEKKSMLSDSFNAAKLGAGMGVAGGGRSPNRAANAGSNKRQAFNPMAGKTASVPSNAELAGALEKAKAASGVKFGEGAGKAGDLLGAGGAPSGGSESNVEPPESQGGGGQESQSDTDTGGGGGGGGSDATCEEAAANLKRATAVVRKGVSDLSAAVDAGKGTETGRDALCNVDGKGSTARAVTDVQGGLNQMTEALAAMSEEGCQTPEEADGWQCGVASRTQRDVSAFVTQVNKVCVPYYTYRMLDKEAEKIRDEGMRQERQILQKEKNLNEYKDKKEEATKVAESSCFTGAEQSLRKLKEELSTEESLLNMTYSGQSAAACPLENMTTFAGDQKDHTCALNSKACKDYSEDFWNVIKANWGYLVAGALLGMGVLALLGGIFSLGTLTPLGAIVGAIVGTIASVIYLAFAAPDLSKDLYQACMANHGNDCKAETANVVAGGDDACSADDTAQPAGTGTDYLNQSADSWRDYRNVQPPANTGTGTGTGMNYM